MSIKAIVRHLGISRNTVRDALPSDAPPRDKRASKGLIVEGIEPEIRALLKDEYLEHERKGRNSGSARL
jgi:hypothetical protein